MDNIGKLLIPFTPLLSSLLSLSSIVNFFLYVMYLLSYLFSSSFLVRKRLNYEKTSFLCYVVAKVLLTTNTVKLLKRIMK